MNCSIELFPIRKPNAPPFNVKEFFSNIIRMDEEEINLSSLDTTSKISELSARLKAKEYKKRMLGRVPFELGDNFKIGIRL